MGDIRQTIVKRGRGDREWSPTGVFSNKEAPLFALGYLVVESSLSEFDAMSCMSRDRPFLRRESNVVVNGGL